MKGDGSRSKRVLLVGAGRWGQNHLRVLRALPVELYVADARPEAYDRVCAPLELPRGRFGTDPLALLDGVDAVDVVTPADTHHRLVLEALRRGKDVFVEKPITVRSDEARELVEEARARGLVLQVGHIFRFDPAVEWLREAVAGGRLGRLRLVKARFAGFKRPRSDSGVLLADGIHFLDLFSFVAGRRPRRVTAVLGDSLGRGMDDEACVSLEWEDPPLWATLECGYHVPGKLREVVAVGSELSAVCDLNQPRLKVKTYENRFVAEGGEWKAYEGEAQDIEFQPVEPLRAELQAFLDSAATRRPPLAGGEAGLESLRLYEAAVASARERRTVEVS